eukprot:6522512-Pyramimonas_sp.AAC.1
MDGSVALSAGESAVRIPLQRWASTRSPAALAAQGRAMAARRACFVVSSAARSSTQVGSSSPVMGAIAEMRGLYPLLQRSGEAVPPIPTDLSNRRSGPWYLRRKLSTHCSEILSKALFWSQKMTAVPGALLRNIGATLSSFGCL